MSSEILRRGCLRERNIQEAWDAIDACLADAPSREAIIATHIGQRQRQDRDGDDQCPQAVLETRPQVLVSPPSNAKDQRPAQRVRWIAMLGSGLLATEQVGTVLLDDLEEGGVLDVPKRLVGLVLDEEAEVGQ